MTEYKNAQYQKGIKSNKNSCIKVNINDCDKISFVPLDPANTDYAEILKQVKAKKLTVKEAK